MTWANCISTVSDALRRPLLVAQPKGKNLSAAQTMVQGRASSGPHGGAPDEPAQPKRIAMTDLTVITVAVDGTARPTKPRCERRRSHSDAAGGVTAGPYPARGPSGRPARDRSQPRHPAAGGARDPGPTDRADPDSGDQRLRDPPRPRLRHRHRGPDHEADRSTCFRTAPATPSPHGCGTIPARALRRLTPSDSQSNRGATRIDLTHALNHDGSNCRRSVSSRHRNAVCKRRHRRQLVRHRQDIDHRCSSQRL